VGFISLTWSILEQQVSRGSAVAHFNGSDSYLYNFVPTEIMILNDEEMQSYQRIMQRSENRRPNRSIAAYSFWHYYLREETVDTDYSENTEGSIF